MLRDSICSVFTKGRSDMRSKIKEAIKEPLEMVKLKSGDSVPIRTKEYLNGKLASPSNEFGLERLGTVRYKGKVYDYYDSGFGNMHSSYRCLVLKESPEIVEANVIKYNIGDEVIYNGDHYIITQMSEDGACVLKNLENMDDPYIGIPVYRLERSPNTTIEIPDDLYDEFFSDEETDEYDEGSIKESQNTGMYKILDDTWYSSNETAYYCIEGPGAGNMGVRNSMESILRDKGYTVDVQLSGFGSELRVERSVPREVLEDALGDLEAEIRKER